MSVPRPQIRWLGVVGLVSVAAGCSLSQRSAKAEAQVTACTAAAASSWTWRTERLSDASIEVPTSFVERRTGDTRSRNWQDGPREITLTLTSDPHAARKVSHFVKRCELEVGDRVIEVVESQPGGSTRELLALVPHVEGGPSLQVRVSTPYGKELDGLRRIISSIRVDQRRVEK